MASGLSVTPRNRVYKGPNEINFKGGKNSDLKKVSIGKPHLALKYVKILL